MARQSGGEISHFSRAETASFHRRNCIQIDVPRKFPKLFLEYTTIKTRVLRNSFVRNSWYKPLLPVPSHRDFGLEDGMPLTAAPCAGTGSFLEI